MSPTTRSRGSYSELDLQPVRGTISLLEQRILERFPDSSLARICAELGRLAEESGTVIQRQRRPIWWLRVLIAIAIAGVVGVVAWAIDLSFDAATGDSAGIADLLQAIDAATNEVIFLALTLLFLASLETRLKRRFTLESLHRIRSIVHVVDMHQLTKDPGYTAGGTQPTQSSPVRTLSAAELSRYLDYCSEMLALCSKLAALQGQYLDDPVVLGAVNELEDLTVGLSGKIWQKIMILHMAQPASPA